MQSKQDKQARIHAIRLIVNSQQIESQEDLLVELDKAGFPCKQGTLSRYLKQLRISKVRMNNGRSVYAMDKEAHFAVAPSLTDMNKGRWAVQFSGNLIVIHTPPGHASMVAYDLDNSHTPLLLGTVAGDDTILVVMAEGADRNAVEDVLREKIVALRTIRM